MSAFGPHGRKCQCDWSKYACPEHGFEDRMAMREAFDEAEIITEREGSFRWSWQAHGILRRAQEGRGVVTLPTGHSTVVGRGLALTRRAARRQARRSLRRWT